METLPTELRRSVLGTLGVRDSASLGLCNKEWHGLLKENVLEREFLDLYRDIDVDRDFVRTTPASPEYVLISAGEASCSITAKTFSTLRDRMGGTRSLLDSMDLGRDRVVLAGGAVVDWLRGTPPRDLDLFVMGDTMLDLKERAKEAIRATVAWTASSGAGVRIRVSNRAVVTIEAKDLPEVQVILCPPGSNIASLMERIDLPPCRTFYDGSSIHMTHECYQAWARGGYDVRDLYATRASFFRACRYARVKGFQVHLRVEDVDRATTCEYLSRLRRTGMLELFLPSGLPPNGYKYEHFTPTRLDACFKHVTSLTDADMTFFSGQRFRELHPSAMDFARALGAIHGLDN